MNQIFDHSMSLLVFALDNIQHLEREKENYHMKKNLCLRTLSRNMDNAAACLPLNRTILLLSLGPVRSTAPFHQMQICILFLSLIPSLDAGVSIASKLIRLFLLPNRLSCVVDG